MGIQTLTTFFMWCTIINGALLILWTVMLILAPDLVYRTQSKWFPIGSAHPKGNQCAHVNGDHLGLKNNA